MITHDNYQATLIYDNEMYNIYLSDFKNSEYEYEFYTYKQTDFDYGENNAIINFGKLPLWSVIF